MKKIPLNAALAGLLIASAGLVHAGEPVVLTAQQMDSIAAGLQRSDASAIATATYGYTAAVSQTVASVNGPVNSTSATGAAVSFGVGATASATASTTF